MTYVFTCRMSTKFRITGNVFLVSLKYFVTWLWSLFVAMSDNVGTHIYKGTFECVFKSYTFTWIVFEISLIVLWFMCMYVCMWCYFTFSACYCFVLLWTYFTFYDHPAIHPHLCISMLRKEVLYTKMLCFESKTTARACILYIHVVCEEKTTTSWGKVGKRRTTRNISLEL